MSICQRRRNTGYEHGLASKEFCCILLTEYDTKEVAVEALTQFLGSPVSPDQQAFRASPVRTYCAHIIPASGVERSSIFKVWRMDESGSLRG